MPLQWKQKVALSDSCTVDSAAVFGSEGPRFERQCCWLARKVPTTVVIASSIAVRVNGCTVLCWECTSIC